MSRALLLFTAGLTMMGATCVLSSSGSLTAVAGAVFALVGAAGVSSSSDVSETSRFMFSSSTGAGRAGAGWALDLERGAMFELWDVY